MSVFADTSALYALLVASEDSHAVVRTTFAELLEADRAVWTTSFVLVETMALLQHRIGLAAARDFDDEILPFLKVDWVGDDLYHRAIARLWREDRRDLSLVDCVSMEFMKQRGLTIAFALDSHFKDAGFTLLPA